MHAKKYVFFVFKNKQNQGVGAYFYIQVWAAMKDNKFLFGRFHLECDCLLFYATFFFLSF